MQILLIPSISGFIFSTIYGAFALLAKVYDIFIDVTAQYQNWDYFNLKTLGTMMYVLAGIFMLFRVTVSLVQMLVNPDLVSDNTVGTGKLITKIITVILMLVVFMPNGLIFGSDGILNRLELALIDSGEETTTSHNNHVYGRLGNKQDLKEVGTGHQKGLIYRIIDNSLENKLTDEELDEVLNKSLRKAQYERIINPVHKITNENTKGALVCYYLDIQQHSRSTIDAKYTESGNTEIYKKWNIQRLYKIVFYNDGRGENKLYGTNFSYTSLHNEVINYQDRHGDEQIAVIHELPEEISDNSYSGGVAAHLINPEWNQGSFNNNVFPTVCPKRLEARQELKIFNGLGDYYVAYDNLPYGEDIRDCGGYDGNGYKDNSEWSNQGFDVDECDNKGIIGGFEKEEQLVEFLKKLGDDEDEGGEVETHNVIQTKKWWDLFGETLEAFNIADPDNMVLLTGLNNRDQVLLFVRNIAKNFQECSDEAEQYGDIKVSDLTPTQLDTYCSSTGNSKQCSCVQRYQFDTIKDNDNMVGLIDSNKLEVSFVASIIAGIAIAIYLLFLIVEIIVRRLKLVLLEMIAPIPIICYANPKDKVFEQWIKMYISTYVDLFIKLFAICFGIYLLKFIQYLAPKGFFGTIAYIIAILIFMKAIPTMLSKLTGLDNLGGSFKDIFNLTRKGLGAATGVGMNVGANTIRTLGNFGAAASAGHWGTAAGSLVRGGLGTIGSVLTGAGAGWNGKGRQAASNTLQRGNVERKALASGASWSAVSWEGTKKRFGFDTTYEVAEAREKDDKAFIQEMDVSKEMALKIAGKEVSEGSTVLEFDQYHKIKQAYEQVALGHQVTITYINPDNGRIKTETIAGGDMVKAESWKKKVEGDVLKRVMTDAHYGGLGSYLSDVKNANSLDRQKLMAQKENLDTAAAGIGISQAKLYDRRNTKIFQKDTKDAAEISQINQQQTMRRNAATQGLVNFNNQNRGH